VTVINVVDTINETSERLNDALLTLRNSVAEGDEKRIDAKINAIVTAQEIWDTEQSEHEQKGKLHKFFKNYASIIDYQIKHSTGGARHGYSFVMLHIRDHI